MEATFEGTVRFSLPRLPRRHSAGPAAATAAMAASAGRDFAIIGAGVAGVSCAAALSRGLADGDAEVETRVHLIDLSLIHI